MVGKWRKEFLLSKFRKTTPVFKFKLVNDERDVALSDTKILDQLKVFYSNLYSNNDPKSLDLENYLEKLNLYHTLSETNSDSCVGLITKEECERLCLRWTEINLLGLTALVINFIKLLE